MIGEFLRKLFPDRSPDDIASDVDSHKSLIQDTYSTIDALAEKRRKVEAEKERFIRASPADALLNARDRVVLP